MKAPTPTTGLGEASAKGPCRVVIIDDHPHTTFFLSEFISGRPGFFVAGTGSNPSSALELCRRERPDIIVIDLGLPERSHGLKLIRELHESHPAAGLLVFSAFSTRDLVQEALRSGASGFVEKTADFEELATALDRIRSGSVYLSPHVSDVLREVVRRGPLSHSLEAREGLALRLLMHGRVVKEIARELSVSSSMVYKILTRLRQKLHAKTNEDLVVLALENGLVDAGSDCGGSPAART